jgi:hypothetical protein
MHELKKNWKDIYEYICWDRAIKKKKKNLLGRGITKVEKHCLKWTLLHKISLL